ncbi:hypothetical protein H2200_004205 [Cladophialophora chaetospira]|uniref:Rhodopsin domain-containing protein n=1 Tax=Cladophialophora chaetospira TaxID=386627 RepID=A0AA38XFP0_9EURO|nr:hypothetical protein H2200_004205 [Cladophialophora chaetospira]
MPAALHPPLSVIASWPEPNFVDPPTRGPGLEYICIIFSLLTIFVVTARIYLRLFITRAAGWDDFLIVVALIFSIPMCVLIIVANKLYFSGRHIWDVPPSTFAPHRLNVWISEWLSVFAGTAIKVSVLLFYRRLSVKFTKAFLIATWIGIVYNLLYLLAFTLTLLLICRPVEALWNAFSQEWAATHNFQCAKEGASIPAAVGLSVLGDFYSTLLPLVLIFGLSLPPRQKLALYSLFALGFLACALGVVRVVILNQMLNVSFDFTWLLWEMWIVTVLEIYLAMFAASAPALKPFLHRFVAGTRDSLARYSKRRSDRKWAASFAGQHQKRTSSSTAGETDLDVERIGTPATGGSAEMRERGFWKDIGRQVTRRFEMRSDHDGKIFLVQIRSPDVATSRPEPAYNRGWVTSEARGSTENQPLPSTLNKPLPLPPASSSRPFVPSQSSEQTIHVGLQLETETSDIVPTLGIVNAGRPGAVPPAGILHHKNSATSAGFPGSTNARLEAPSSTNQDASIRHGTNTAMQTTKLLLNRAATIKSNTASIHSRSRSRDFDPKGGQVVHSIRDGYTI